ATAPDKEVRPLLASLDGAERSGRRRPLGGFLVAGAALGGVVLLGAMWARGNLGAKPPAERPVAASAVDPKVATLLTAGEKALAEGNLELAKESLDKASVLAEKDVHVLAAAARLAAMRADVAWLKSRLLPSDAADEQRITRDSLTELGAAARKA